MQYERSIYYLREKNQATDVFEHMFTVKSVESD